MDESKQEMRTTNHALSLSHWFSPHFMGGLMMLTLNFQRARTGKTTKPPSWTLPWQIALTGLQLQLFSCLLGFFQLQLCLRLCKGAKGWTSWVLHINLLKFTSVQFGNPVVLQLQCSLITTCRRFDCIWMICTGVLALATFVHVWHVFSTLWPLRIVHLGVARLSTENLHVSMGISRS